MDKVHGFVPLSDWTILDDALKVWLNIRQFHISVNSYLGINPIKPCENLSLVINEGFNWSGI